MASTYTPLGIELQATGENAGTWGTKTNTNLQIIEQISGGFTQQALTSGGTVNLSVSDGSTGATLSHRMIEFTGSLSDNAVVTIPLDVQTFYFLRNSSSGAYTVQFKYVTGSGDSFTFSATDKGDQLVFAAADDGVNPNIKTLAFGAGDGDVTLTGTQTLTNKTLTSPKIGTSILDTNGNELALLTATGSAVNEITLANGATGNNPSITASGGDTNIGLALKTKGSGVIQAEDSGGNVSAVKIAGKETIWVPSAAMYGATTNPADAQQVETTATRPDMKVLDFDKDTDEFAQFSIAMPKSWNEGTLTYQVYWTPGSTNTGDCIFGLQAVACADNDTIDVAYGTAVNVTDAGIGTLEDQQISSESGALTVAGSPAAGELTYFQLFRDANAGGDTFTADARVLGVKIFFTTDAANDL
tara:strand:+ start:548 stop:1792 length:1245 start_codon:yes stop_codon:yes gene_type:complete